MNSKKIMTAYQDMQMNIFAIVAIKLEKQHGINKRKFDHVTSFEYNTNTKEFEVTCQCLVRENRHELITVYVNHPELDRYVNQQQLYLVTNG
ncbi:hypothetical protein NVP1081O_177 [Vibrio phage 1.081.O._10N.286.52.C2]|nr:hypothetical protein NVP1081O_177 [Vibrio phage 1.081.O._10N.286.52.C2]